MTESRLENCIFPIGAILFPLGIFVYLCERNISELASLRIVYFAILVVFVLSAILYGGVRLVLKHPFSAMIFTDICWIAVYIQEPISEAIPTAWRYAIRLRGLAVIFVIFGLAFGALSVRYTAEVKNKVKWATLVCAVCGLVFLMNFSMFLVSTFQRANADSNTSSKVKTTFNLQSGKKEPNVYWIHPDGMLGVGAYEKYYGVGQDDFLSFMEKRGFVFNKTAQFEATHNTSIAIPALTCPDAYDKYIAPYMTEHDLAMNAARKVSFVQQAVDFRKQNEMIGAFVQKGYNVTVIGPIRFYYPPVGGSLYMGFGGEGDHYVTRVEPEVMDALEGSDTIETLGRISVYLRVIFDFLNDKVYKRFIMDNVVGDNSQPFKSEPEGDIYSSNIPATDNYSIAALWDSLYDSDFASPRLTIVHDGTPHGPFKYNEDGTVHESSTRPEDYQSQHIWSESVVMTMVDMILERDPGAVIIIQADHGLHVCTEEEFKTAFDGNVDAIELWNSTMSAIRVPDEYKTGDEQYAYDNPLNMSRYIINGFVGNNYEYVNQ